MKGAMQCLIFRNDLLPSVKSILGVSCSRSMNVASMSLTRSVLNGCGSWVWGEGSPPAIVVPDPLVSSGPDINEAEFPEVFVACARKHSQKPR